MTFRLSVTKIKELIAGGYYTEAFLEIMRNRIKWKDWSESYIPNYLIGFFGEQDVVELYKATQGGYSNRFGCGYNKKLGYFKDDYLDKIYPPKSGNSISIPDISQELDKKTSSIKRLYLEKALETANNFIRSKASAKEEESI